MWAVPFTRSIVAHGVVCKVLVTSLVPGLSAADWNRLGSVRNVAVQELLREDGAWRLVRFNDLPEAVRNL